MTNKVTFAVLCIAFVVWAFFAIYGALSMGWGC